MASRTSQMVAKLDAAHALDLKALLAYASVNVPGFPLSPSDFTVSQVKIISVFCVSVCVNFFDFFFFFWLCIVRAWAIEPYVSDGSESIGGIGETLRFEEEAAGEIARVCSRRRERVSGFFLFSHFSHC